AGREGLVARAGDDGDPHVGVVPHVDPRLRQLGVDIGVHRVHGLGAVDGNARDAVVDFVDQLHALSLASARMIYHRAMSDEILLAVADDVATVTLNRPHTRNAMNAALLRALAAVLDDLETRRDVREVVAAADVETVAAALARTLADNAPLSLAGIKVLLARALAARDQVAHDDLDALIQAARRSQDAGEGRRAILEKRKPVFRGE